MRTFQLGVLLGLSPGIWIILSILASDIGGVTGTPLWVAAGLGALHGVGVLLARFAPRVGRSLLTAAWLGVAAASGEAVLQSPLWALLLVLGIGWVLVWVWNLTALPIRSAVSDVSSNALSKLLLGVAVSSGALWFGSVVAGGIGGEALLVLAGMGWALNAGLLWWMGWLKKRLNIALWISASAAFLGVVLWLLPRPLWTTALLAPLWLAAASIRRNDVIPVGARRDLSLWWALWADPARNLVSTFLLIGLAGGLILSSPLCAAQAPQGVPLLDAMFTSFSATCVTGLGVLDTPGAFSWLGQAVILGLIQVGGLGIMTFSTAGLALMGRRLSLQHEATLAEMLATDNRRDLHQELKRVLLVTFVAEALGAAVLAVLFMWGGEGFWGAVWRGLFTSVSAFCNAGFALQSDSLVGFQQSPLVLHTVGLLIIAGGLGPAVVLATPALVRGTCRSLQAKLVWRTTLALLVVPAVLIWLIEAPHTLRDLGWFDAFNNAWFQSVTLRTAGFNSIDLTAVQPATISLMMAAMFIGGSPGSTAGGIKTTSIILLFAGLRATLRGHDEADILGFYLPRRTVLRAAAISLMGALSVFAFVLLLQLTQAMPLQVVLFEAISALATVGLTIGGTGALDSIGKVLIIAAMFAGRVGPLTLIMFLTARQPSSDRPHLPEQDIAVG
jgi:trk system potassium uptake protein TrkH